MTISLSLLSSLILAQVVPASTLMPQENVVPSELVPGLKAPRLTDYSRRGEREKKA